VHRRGGLSRAACAPRSRGGGARSHLGGPAACAAARAGNPARSLPAADRGAHPRCLAGTACRGALLGVVRGSRRRDLRRAVRELSRRRERGGLLDGRARLLGRALVGAGAALHGAARDRSGAQRDGRARPAFRRRARLGWWAQPHAGRRDAAHRNARSGFRDRPGRGGPRSIPAGSRRRLARCRGGAIARARGLRAREGRRASPERVPRSLASLRAGKPAPPHRVPPRVSRRDRMGPRRERVPARPGPPATGRNRAGRRRAIALGPRPEGPAGRHRPRHRPLLRRPLRVRAGPRRSWRRPRHQGRRPGIEPRPRNGRRRRDRAGREHLAPRLARPRARDPDGARRAGRDAPHSRRRGAERRWRPRTRALAKEAACPTERRSS
jgi:hypothetical protein